MNIKRIAVTLLLTIITLASAARSAEKLRFGVNNWAPESEMRKIFRPLMDYLEEQTGIKIDIVIPSNYDELLKRTAGGDIDLAAFNSVTYLKARHSGKNVHYLATLLKRDEGSSESRDFYVGYIIVRKDSKYKTLDDLKGKIFAFVDFESGSGYKMPAALLATTGRGGPGEFFEKYFFVGDHDEVASAVYHGCVDGGATWDNSYKLNTAKDRFGDAFRIIERISPIPNDAWVTSPKVKPEIAEKIKRVLLTINEDTRTSDGRLVLDLKAGFPGTGWSERSPAFYEKQAKLLLYTDK